MVKKDLYRYYCQTENKLIREKVNVGDPIPIVCKNNSLHTVDWSSLNILEKSTDELAASNIGEIGIGLLKNITNKTIRLKNLATSSTKISLTNNINNNTIGIDVSESNININNLSGAPSGNVIGTTDIQTLSNKTLVDSTTVFRDNSDSTKKFKFQLSSISSNNTRVIAIPNASTMLVGINNDQLLTNKTINANDNTIININNSCIKNSANINANKLANGTVSNAEFQYLQGVTSSIQTQLNSKLSTSHNHLASNITSGTFANARISQSNIIQHQSAIDHGSIYGLNNDDHIQYLLITGRSGGQNIIGGNNATNNIVLQSTSHSNRGKIIMNDQLLVNDIDTRTATTLQLGKSIATKLELADTGIITEIKGNLNAQGGLNVIGNITVSGIVDGRDLATDGINLDRHVVASSNIHGIIGSFVGTTDIQTLTNKSLSDSTTYFSNIGDSTKKLQFQLSSLSSGTTRVLTIPDSNTTIVGTELAQNITNKYIDADLNTLTNIDNNDIKTGATINANKLANGTVSNTSFQYINTLSSNAQTQLNKKITGPNSATNNGIVRFDNTSGNIVQNSDVLIDDGDNITGIKSLNITNSLSGYLLTVRNNTLGGEILQCQNNAGNNVFEINKNGGDDGIVKIKNANGHIGFVSDAGYCKIGPTSTDVDTNYLLTVEGNASNNGLLIKTGSSANTFGIKMEDHNSSSQYFSVNAATKSVGIGTWSPTYGLDNQNSSGNSADINTQNGVFRIAGAQLSLNHLSDSIISTPSNGHVLKYNGSNWVNATTTGFDWQGVWVSRNYTVYQAVSYNGSSYICKVATTTSQLPTDTSYWDQLSVKGDTGATGSTGQEGLVWKNTWNNATSYVIDDAITYDGTSYICIQSHTNNVPPNATYWQVLALKGDSGLLADWQGAWISQNYTINQAVSYNGSSYICILNTTYSQNPLNTSFWNLVAEKGANGSGTSISFRDEGTNIANTPHGTANFVGQNVQVQDGGSGIATITIGPHCFYAYDIGGFTQLSGSWTDLPWDTEGRKDSIYAHSSNSVEITINQSGWFDVGFDVSMESTSGSRSEAEVRVVEYTGSGYIEVAGTRANFYCRKSGYGSSCSVRFLRQFTPGNKIKLQGIRVAGSGTIKTLSKGTRVIIKTI